MASLFLRNLGRKCAENALRFARPMPRPMSTTSYKNVNYADKVFNQQMRERDEEDFLPEDEFSDDELEFEKTVRRQPKIDNLGRAHGVGRRKTAVARVWIRPGTGSFYVNKSPLHEKVTRDRLLDDILEPMYVTGALGQFDVECLVHGGGFMGQAGALRHGLARALDNFQPSLRKTLRTCGMMTRDPRMVERKKPGQPKARKKKQWVKR
mmetsp:Transcript_17399/g.25801  ORF Transcript_17399/g.25801 Transcript_17399/m.25801 type:complete len:209 (+) Transcript_17399:1-627(+)